MTGTLVVREMRNDGKQEVYILHADDWTLDTFQGWWMPGVDSYGRPLRHGSEVNEILGYYPNYEHSEEQDLEGDDPMENSHHTMWADPDGIPSRYSGENEL